MNLPVPMFLLPRWLREDLDRRCALTGQARREVVTPWLFGFRLRIGLRAEGGRRLPSGDDVAEK